MPQRKRKKIMIIEAQGNLLNANVEAIVNTVNCVGVMGKGLALAFKQAYPTNFAQYKEACNVGKVKPGEMFITKINKTTNSKYIINFPTKRHWREKSYLVDVELGLVALVAKVKELEINSIAIPALGCGLGGLDWQIVKPLIINAFSILPDVEVMLFAPKD